jgi:hypothetical protein
MDEANRRLSGDGGFICDQDQRHLPYLYQRCLCRIHACADIGLRCRVAREDVNVHRLIRAARRNGPAESGSPAGCETGTSRQLRRLC